MDRTSVCVLLLLSSTAAFGKYVYVEKRATWHEAREHCRRFHTDLAPVSGARDIKLLERLLGRPNVFVWIGLERNSTDRGKWTWSGGGGVATFFWAHGCPTERPLDNYGAIYNSRWYDSGPHHRVRFLCYAAVAVRERKTWEEALGYCREHHRDLASVASETETLLIQKELGKNETTGRVWVGLRFLSGRWLWADGQPLKYEAWGGGGGEPGCPEVGLGCGALQVAAAAAAWGSNATTESAWEAHNCEERLHFICY